MSDTDSGRLASANVRAISSRMAVGFTPRCSNRDNEGFLFSVLIFIVNPGIRLQTGIVSKRTVNT